MNDYEIRIVRASDDSQLVITAKLLGDHAAVRRAQILAGDSNAVEVWRGTSCVYSMVPNAICIHQSRQMPKRYLSRCGCGVVEATVIGKPIIANICYCGDCQAAARLIAGRPGGTSTATPDGGTECLVFRKARITLTKGAERLEALKLKEGSTTRRMIAACCNTGMYMTFDDAKPWVSAFRARFPAVAKTSYTDLLMNLPVGG